MEEGGLYSPGDLFEGHRIVRLIAVGGFAEVYEGLDEFTRRPVALKFVKTRHQGNMAVAKRAEGEVVTLCKLNHPNLVHVYRGGVLPDGTVWMSMELLHGVTLREYTRLNPEAGEPSGPRRLRALGLAEAFAIGMAAGDALSALHEEGVVHRDVKPDNVFVTQNQNQVKLFDINSAKFYGMGFKSTVPGQSPGTPAYMAPEQFMPDQKPDSRADIYSLGLVLYEMLAGNHPLAVSNGGEMPPSLPQIIIAQMTWEPVPLTKLGVCSEEAWQIVLKSIAKNPDDRYSRVTDLVRDLRAARQRHLESTPAARYTQGVASSPGKKQEYGWLNEPPRGLQPDPEASRRVIAQGASPVTVPKKIVQRTVMQLPEAELHALMNEVRALGERGDDRARAALLDAVFRPKHPAACAMALEELAKIGLPPNLPPLEKALEAELNPILRARIEATILAIQGRAIPAGTAPTQMLLPGGHAPQASLPTMPAAARGMHAHMSSGNVPTVPRGDIVAYATTQAAPGQHAPVQAHAAQAVQGAQGIGGTFRMPQGMPLPAMNAAAMHPGAVIATAPGSNRNGQPSSQPGTPMPVTKASEDFDAPAPRPWLKLIAIGCAIGTTVAAVGTVTWLKLGREPAAETAPAAAAAESAPLPADPPPPPAPDPAPPEQAAASPEAPATAASSAAALPTQPPAKPAAAPIEKPAVSKPVAAAPAGTAGDVVPLTPTKPPPSTKKPAPTTNATTGLPKADF
jgi:serine/threonine protein kinase